MSEIRNNEHDRVHNDRPEPIRDMLLECFARPSIYDNSLQSTAPAMVYVLDTDTTRIVIRPGQVREIIVTAQDGTEHGVLVRNTGLRLEAKSKTDQSGVAVHIHGTSGELQEIYAIPFNSAKDKGWHRLLPEETLALSGATEPLNLRVREQFEKSATVMFCGDNKAVRLNPWKKAHLFKEGSTAAVATLSYEPDGITVQRTTASPNLLFVKRRGFSNLIQLDRNMPTLLYMGDRLFIGDPALVSSKEFHIVRSIGNEPSVLPPFRRLQLPKLLDDTATAKENVEHSRNHLSNLKLRVGESVIEPTRSVVGEVRAVDSHGRLLIRASNNSPLPEWEVSGDLYLTEFTLEQVGSADQPSSSKVAWHRESAQAFLISPDGTPVLKKYFYIFDRAEVITQLTEESNIKAFASESIAELSESAREGGAPIELSERFNTMVQRFLKARGLSDQLHNNVKFYFAISMPWPVVHTEYLANGVMRSAFFDSANGHFRDVNSREPIPDFMVRQRVVFPVEMLAQHPEQVMHDAYLLLQAGERDLFWSESSRRSACQSALVPKINRCSTVLARELERSGYEKPVDLLRRSELLNYAKAEEIRLHKILDKAAKSTTYPTSARIGEVLEKLYSLRGSDRVKETIMNEVHKDQRVRQAFLVATAQLMNESQNEIEVSASMTRTGFQQKANLEGLLVDPRAQGKSFNFDLKVQRLNVVPDSESVRKLLQIARSQPGNDTADAMLELVATEDSLMRFNRGESCSVDWTPALEAKAGRTITMREWLAREDQRKFQLRTTLQENERPAKGSTSQARAESRLQQTLKKGAKLGGFLVLTDVFLSLAEGKAKEPPRSERPTVTGHRKDQPALETEVVDR